MENSSLPVGIFRYNTEKNEEMRTLMRRKYESVTDDNIGADGKVNPNTEGGHSAETSRAVSFGNKKAGQRTDSGRGEKRKNKQTKHPKTQRTNHKTYQKTQPHHKPQTPNKERQQTKTPKSKHYHNARSGMWGEISGEG